MLPFVNFTASAQDSNGLRAGTLPQDVRNVLAAGGSAVIQGPHGELLNVQLPGAGFDVFTRAELAAYQAAGNHLASRWLYHIPDVWNDTDATVITWALGPSWLAPTGWASVGGGALVGIHSIDLAAGTFIVDSNTGGAPIDITQFAKLAAPNTFTAANTFDLPITAADVVLSAPNAPAAYNTLLKQGLAIAAIMANAPANFNEFFEVYSAWLASQNIEADLTNRINVLETFTRFLSTDNVREGQNNKYYTSQRAYDDLSTYFGLKYPNERDMAGVGGYSPGTNFAVGFYEALILTPATVSNPHLFVIPTTSGSSLSDKGAIIGFRCSNAGPATVKFQNGATVRAGDYSTSKSVITLNPGDWIIIARNVALYGYTETDFRIVAGGSLAAYL